MKLAQQQNPSWILIFLLCTQTLPITFIRVPALAAAGFLVLITATLRARESRTIRPPIAFGLFVALAPMSALWSIHPRETLLQSTQLILLFFITASITFNSSIERIQRSFLVSLKILMVLSVLAEAFARNGFLLQERRSTLFHGVTANPNILAFLCVLAVISIACSEMTRTHKALWQIFPLFLLIGARSNGAWTYLALAIVIAFTLRALRHTPPMLRPVLTIAGTVLATWALSSPLVTRAIARATGAAENVTLSGRTNIWSGSWSGIQERPWLGYGYEALREPTRLVPIDMGVLWSDVGFERFNAHNGYIDLVLQLGFLGAFALLSIIAYRAMVFFRDYMHGGNQWPLLLLLTLVAYNLTETRIMTPQFAWVTIVTLVTVARFEAPEPAQVHAKRAEVPRLLGVQRGSRQRARQLRLMV